MVHDCWPGPDAPAAKPESDPSARLLHTHAVTSRTKGAFSTLALGTVETETERTKTLPSTSHSDMTRPFVCLGLMPMLLCPLLASGASREFYVDPANGSDSANGSAAHPFKTAAHAADAAAAASMVNGTSAVSVLLADGMYADALMLGPAQSGSPSAAITFQPSSPGSTNVVFSGGKHLPGAVFSRAPAPSKVYTVDLKKQGLDVSLLGHLAPGELGTCNQDVSQVFIDGQPLLLARYPNVNASSGYNEWMNIAQVQSATRAFSLSPSQVSPARLAAWADEDALWFHGYWSQDWADSYVQASSLDGYNVTVQPETPPVYGFKPKARVMAVNALSELDAPGEYYVSQDGILSLIPFGDALPAEAEVVLTTKKTAAGCQLCLDGASHLTFAGLQVAYSAGAAIVAHGVTDVHFKNMSIGSGPGDGIRLDGSASSVSGSEVANLGCKGVIVSGGDFATLTPSNNVVANNSIFNFSRLVRTYNPGISWSGVGFHVVGNQIRDAPHAAILGGGQDSLFENNTIAHVAFEVSDSGGFYTGRSWIERGNVLRFNTFSGVRTRVPIFLGYPSVQAIYLDDQMSGYFIHHNTFVDCQVGMFIGGGRRNTVLDNTFESCDTAVHLDSRGQGCFNPKCYPQCPGNCDADTIWGANGIDGSVTASGQFVPNHKWAVLPFAQRFPELATIAEDGTLGDPVHNVIQGNVVCGCHEFLDQNVTKITAEWMGVVTANEVRANCSS